MNENAFINIQYWMVSKLNLTDKELIVFAIVFNFSQDGESELLSGNSFVQKFMGWSRPTVSKAFNSLVEKNLIIKRVETLSNVNFNRYKVNYMVVKNLYMGSKESLHGGSKESLHGGSKESLHMKELLDITRNNILLEEKKETSIEHYKDDKAFIEDWNYARIKYLKVKASNIRTLTHYELINFRKANATYTIDEFRKGMEGLLMQKEIFDTMKLRPNHFLDEGNIDKYIDAFNNKKHLYKITSKDGRL